MLRATRMWQLDDETREESIIVSSFLKARGYGDMILVHE